MNQLERVIILHYFFCRKCSLYFFFSNIYVSQTSFEISIRGNLKTIFVAPIDFKLPKFIK